MRILAIGDIHGCLRALDAILDRVAPNADDLVIALGDYVDRGPDSNGVLNRLLELQTRCRLVALKGNHDLMMVAARVDLEHFEEWLKCGGEQTLRSYRANQDWNSFSEGIPAQHWEFLEKCLAFKETRKHFFVHANAHPDMPLPDQPDYMRYWEQLHASTWRPHESGKTMVCGHTVQRSGQPLVLDKAVCIDTWVYGDGWLTCLDVEKEICYQANQRGEARIEQLDIATDESL